MPLKNSARFDVEHFIPVSLELYYNLMIKISELQRNDCGYLASFHRWRGHEAVKLVHLSLLMETLNVRLSRCLIKFDEAFAINLELSANRSNSRWLNSEFRIRGRDEFC